MIILFWKVFSAPGKKKIPEVQPCLQTEKVALGHADAAAVPVKYLWVTFFATSATNFLVSTIHAIVPTQR